ncbi:unnamed protein product [Rotaria socialis]
MTIERLVSIRWPMEKQRLVSSYRMLIILVICFLFPALVYKVSECSNLTVTSIAETKAYKYFDFGKEIIFHFIRICILVCVNFPLLSTLHTASKKFKAQRRSSESIILASPTVRFQSITMILM